MAKKEWWWVASRVGERLRSVWVGNGRLVRSRGRWDFMLTGEEKKGQGRE